MAPRLALVVLAVLSLGLGAAHAPAAEAAIINGQFTGAIDSGTITTFNPDFSIQSQAPIAAGTTFNGIFRIDTSLLPAGNTTSTGDVASLLLVQTRHDQTGGAEWLTAQATLGLPSPVDLAFRRDPVVPKPANAISLSGNPTSSQNFSYKRGFTSLPGFERCCDGFTIVTASSDSWGLPDASLFAGYSTSFGFSVSEATPAMLPGDSGVPDSASFVNGGIDPLVSFDDTSGFGSFRFASGVNSVAGGFSAFLFEGTFEVLAASFIMETATVPAPGAPALLIGAGLLLLRRRSGSRR